MALYLLDSDVVISCLRGVKPALALVSSLYNQGDDLCTCDVVIAEIYSGVFPEQESFAEALLGPLSFLATSPEIARQAGQWRFAQARRGLTLGTPDCMIAATAHAHGATLVTGNVKDYPMPELRLLPLAR